MMKLQLFIFANLIGIFSTAYSAVISVAPDSAVIPVGSNFDVTASIDGLGVNQAPSVSTYDITISYDPSIITAGSVTFGDTILGNQLDLFNFGFNIQDVVNGAGAINIFELSFDLPGDLNDLQASAFDLFSVSFTAIGIGTSALTLDVISLGDAFGDPLPVAISNSSVSAVPPVPPVPIPAAAWLFLSALGSLGIIKRKRC